VPAVQVVPVPSKHHIHFHENPDLDPSSLLLLALQTNLHSQVALGTAVQLAMLYQKEARLCQALELPLVSRPRCQHFDRAGSRGSLERLAGWFGNSLNFCLYTQGPYCAALLLKVRSPALFLHAVHRSQASLAHCNLWQLVKLV
jgi:hypothetical protein